MEVTVTDYIHVRVGRPSVNAPTYQYLAPGSKLTIDGQLYKGDAYEGIDQWVKDDAGNYYWSGGIDQMKPVTAPKLLKFPPGPPLIYWDEITARGIPNNKGNGVKVAVLDTGIESHADLPLGPHAAIDSTGGNDVSDRSAVGHGTHVAGIIGARAAQPNGITGVAPACELFSYKVNPHNKPTICRYLHTALADLIQRQVRVVNLSFTISEADWNKDPDAAAVEALMKQASASGVILFAASGDNKEMETNQYPACLDSCISVGGFYGMYKPTISKTKYPIHFISYAHSYYSCSNQRNGYYIQLPGSSMNTAFISGIAVRLIHEMENNGLAVTKESVIAALEKYAVGLDHLSKITKDYKFAKFRS